MPAPRRLRTVTYLLRFSPAYIAIGASTIGERKEIMRCSRASRLIGSGFAALLAVASVPAHAQDPNSGACSVNGVCSETDYGSCSLKHGVWLGQYTVCVPMCVVNAFPGHNTVPFQ